jgi:hypothetical protein
MYIYLLSIHLNEESLPKVLMVADSDDGSSEISKVGK